MAVPILGTHEELNVSEYGKGGKVKRKIDSESVLKENKNLRVWLKYQKL